MTAKPPTPIVLLPSAVFESLSPIPKVNEPEVTVPCRPEVRNFYELCDNARNRRFLRSGSKLGSILSQPGERRYGIFRSGSS